MSAENLSADPAVPCADADGQPVPVDGRAVTAGERPQLSGRDGAGTPAGTTISRTAGQTAAAQRPAALGTLAQVSEPRLPLGARPARNAIVAAGLIGYAWWLGGAAAFSTKALIGVLVPGAVLGAIAYGRPPERIPPPERIDVTGFSYWIICIALLFEWEASAVRDSAPPSHPALTTLIDPLIAPHPVKCAAIVIWLLAGWALVKR